MIILRQKTYSQFSGVTKPIISGLRHLRNSASYMLTPHPSAGVEGSIKALQDNGYTRDRALRKVVSAARRDKMKGLNVPGYEKIMETWKKEIKKN